MSRKTTAAPPSDAETAADGFLPQVGLLALDRQYAVLREEIKAAIERVCDSGRFVLGPDVALDRPAFVDPTARIFGRVSAGVGSSFWPYCVIRAEGAAVRVSVADPPPPGTVACKGGNRTNCGR